MKAIVFTHISQRDPEQANDSFIKESADHFEAFCRCRNVSVVFVYVSFGLEQLLKGFNNGDGRIGIALEVVAGEARILNALQIALSVARQRIGGAQGPKFIFIGLKELAELLRRLGTNNSELVDHIAGGAANSTYDAPKFVEAVIRFKLQDDGHPEGDVVLRFDADVGVEPKGIEAILDKVKLERQETNYFFMSGGYAGATPQDYKNIYPVRINWFIEDGVPFSECRRFLRDLGELGATQIGSEVQRSPLFPDDISSQNRTNPQPISGAGLVMSVGAITVLPPFMNFKSRIVWVDDHLKRCLHEQLGHMDPAKIQRVDGVTFKQNRDKKPDEYLDRLARGCLLHAAISDRGMPGPLSLAVKQVVDMQAGKQPNRGINMVALNQRLERTLSERANLLRRVWQGAKYGSPSFDKDVRRLEWKELRDEVREDATRYVDLVKKWPQYQLAIQRLDRIELAWLTHVERPWNVRGTSTRQRGDAHTSHRTRKASTVPHIGVAPPHDTRPLTHQRAPGKAAKVFVGHGRSQEWEKLKYYLEHDLGLPCDEFNSISTAGFLTGERLQQMIEDAKFAFIVMTADDMDADGQRKPRLNVIHEAGLFQGRLGFHKTIILVEEGCSGFSNIDGLTRIQFAKGCLLDKTSEIRGVLVREGILGDHAVRPRSLSRRHPT
jgi:predicted nucleotide-binding protein